MKRHKSIVGFYLHACLVFLFSVKFPYLIFLPLRTSSANNEAPQHFKDIDFTNVTFLDMMARKAMKRLHDDLDHDDDGNVSLIEGAQFIDREDFESRNSNLPGFATDKDGKITEVEFWETWVTSTVHNWTVAEMVEWLSSDVDLPQYAEKFKHFSICGAAMPIDLVFLRLRYLLCGCLVALHSIFNRCFSWQFYDVLTSIKKLLDSNYNALRKVGVYPSAHKRKIQLRAMEVVIFGPPKPKSNLFKDVLLTVSIALALSGMVYAVHVRRSANLAVVAMQEKLNSLQKEMSKLEEDEWTTKSSTADDLDEGNSLNREFSASQASLASESNLQSRLHEVMDELLDARSLLEQTKVRLHDQKWLPPERLVICLKSTHKVETKLHESKRHEAQKKIDQAKAQFLKMKKKTSIFTSVQLVHSHQVDDFDLEVQGAKDFLCEVQREAHEYKKRWQELENICKCRFLASSSRVVTAKRHQSINDVSGGHRIKSDASTLNANGKSRSVDEADDGEGLQMKEIHSHSSEGQKGSMMTQQSCPTLQQKPEHRVTSSPSSQTLPHPRTMSNNVPSAKTPNLERFSDKFRSLPRKMPSPVMERNKTTVTSRKAVTPQSERKTINETSQGWRRSLEPNEHLSQAKKSHSSHSLPDLLSNSDDLRNANGSVTKALENDTAKPLKKRSFFGTKFRKKKTQ